MARVSELHKRWMKEPAYAAEHAALRGEFELARVLVATRVAAGLSQAELAERMGTSQSYIARIEGGRISPSAGVLDRLAQATGTRLRIAFEPVRRASGRQRGPLTVALAARAGQKARRAS